jgi:SAM-dependent methyltransferase
MAFDAVAGRYDDAGEHAQIADALVRLVAPPAGLVVDVATGTGAAAFAALRVLAPERIIAIDVSAGMLGIARRRAVTEDPARRIDWVRQGAVPLPFGEGSVGLVLCASSLHFLGREALGDWRRVLRAGGQAAFSVPVRSSFSPSPQFRRLLPADGVQLPDSADDAEQLLEGSGLRLQRAAGLQAGNRPVVLIVAGKDTAPAQENRAVPDAAASVSAETFGANARGV